jgi:hypothetical protein
VKRTREAKIQEYNDESLVYRFAGDEWIWHFSRREGEGGSMERAK